MRTAATVFLWELIRPLAKRLGVFSLRRFWAYEARRELEHDRRNREPQS